MVFWVFVRWCITTTHSFDTDQTTLHILWFLNHLLWLKSLSGFSLSDNEPMFEPKTKCSFWAKEKSPNKVFNRICPRGGVINYRKMATCPDWFENMGWWGKYEQNAEFVNYLITARDELSNCVNGKTKQDCYINVTKLRLQFPSLDIRRLH